MFSVDIIPYAPTHCPRLAQRDDRSLQNICNNPFPGSLPLVESEPTLDALEPCGNALARLPRRRRALELRSLRKRRAPSALFCNISTGAVEHVSIYPIPRDLYVLPHFWLIRLHSLLQPP